MIVIYDFAFLFAVLAFWLIVFVCLIAYDLMKGNKFKPLQRAIWPLRLIAELVD